MPPPSIVLSFDPPGPNFPITEQVAMPRIAATATLKDVTPDPKASLQFRWKASLVFTGAHCTHSLGRQIRHPDMAGITTVNTWLIPFSQIRGGDLTVSVEVTAGKVVLSQTSKNLQVTGTNPGIGALIAATPNNDAFRKLMRVESGLKQFLGPACPYFSEDNRGGVGICQVTDSPSDDDVWSWKENLKSGWKIFQNKEATARQYPAQVRNSASFKALVKAYNDNRLAQNKPAPPAGNIATATAKTVELKALLIDLPDYTPDQLQRDTIRGYNGYAGGWHEFRPKTDKNGLLVVTVNADGLKGTAEWEEITAAQRIEHYDDLGLAANRRGDPNYVEDVEGKPSF